MRILILGKGYLGREFERQGFEVWGRDKFTTHGIHTPSLRKLMDYNAVVNCIGKADTRYCEDPANFDDIMSTNAVLPTVLSRFCDTNGIKLVHISTGCLYDAPQSTEESFIASHCLYTLSKWAGEVGCCGNDIILRPRLFYGDIRDPRNLLCKMASFDTFVYDAQDSYTDIRDIPKAVRALVNADASGVFNICSNGWGSIYALSASLGLEGKPISIADLRAREGLHLVNSTMDTEKLRRYYEPVDLVDSVMECWEALKGATNGEDARVNSQKEAR